eukprot:gnl/TRDRNA2_/TRDRNA2_206749_c0_seq1.p1 gnl/TRDRNA2_/TRDRNA2_206749_c0~~gnl/TRDRNA2_/TRDRNA2_206749_c0_seq1.p1  ORF type:complete len:179 (+),score=19.59 gnl/TRDRNA2_/TRDRNA2_206749_c0_seq1:3-539(+)
MIQHGRTVFRRWLGIKPDILDEVVDFFEHNMSLYALVWLAVHIRLTDKRESNARPLSVFESEIRCFAKGLACDGVFLCADDAEAKTALASRLRASGLVVVEYPAHLSARGLPAHKDPGLDRIRNARDMLVECLLMAQCKAVLGSWSNISAATLWFAPDGYRHYMFGDAVPDEAFEAVD